MLTEIEAHRLIHQYLGTSSRVRHSLFVGHMMKGMAALLYGHVELWLVVGLCHDLDFQVTEQQRDQNGIVTARWLADKLPPEGLDAIKAHDHRTGVSSDTKLAVALKLADACAIVVDCMGNYAIETLRLENPWPIIHDELASRPYLATMLRENCERLGIDASDLVPLLEAAPPSS